MGDQDTDLQRLLERRARCLGPAYRLFYEHPLHLVRGEGCWLYDAQGNAFLDAYNNVPIVGHCRAEVVEAVAGQLATLNTHTRYLHEGVVQCAERLLALFPAELDRVMFTCTGTEAVELALRLARAATGAEGLIVTAHAYHGNSREAAAISPEEPSAERRADHVVTVPAPDRFRPPSGAGIDLLAHHLDRIDRAIATLEERGVRLAAMLVDTVFSSEGVINTPPGYLSAAAGRVRAAGGLLIADEVQAGFGRLGSAFWGFQRHDTRPDIVTLGKPMGNGYPVAATVCRSDIVDAFSREAGYFNTFGGTPAACAASMAVLDVLEREGLPRRAAATGQSLAEGLHRLQRRFEAIGDVRGEGLYLGVDLVADRDSRTPDAGAARFLANGLRERGVLVGVTGPGANVLKIRPPLVFEEQHAALLLERLSEALTDWERHSA